MIKNEICEVLVVKKKTDMPASRVFVVVQQILSIREAYISGLQNRSCWSRLLLVEALQQALENKQ